MKAFFKKIIRKIKRRDWFDSHFKQLLASESTTKKRFELHKKDFFICLKDKTATTGFCRHYVYHPAWAARIIQQIAPLSTSRHIVYFAFLQHAFGIFAGRFLRLPPCKFAFK